LAEPRLALGLSGGGDSLALLLALRAALPDAELVALVVDHGLRPGSAAEARAAAAMAADAGAAARILTWDSPRSGQSHARRARHRLLADAAKDAGASVLCLAHTMDDRIETLRMRDARPGAERRMGGPSRLDSSPVWPEGEGLVVARPFLDLRRQTLRAYLRRRRASWIDDPSNDDPAYERIRLRRAPISREAEQALLRRSDAAVAELRRLDAAAKRLIKSAAALTPWGGARLSPERFRTVEPATAERALETLMLAVSGHNASAPPDQVRRMLQALLAGRAASAGGAHLTAGAVLGRDAGAAGRADGAAPVRNLTVSAGGGVFDGRWRVHGDRAVSMALLGVREAAPAPGVPPALRPGLAAVFDSRTGERIATAGLEPAPGVTLQSLAPARIAARLLPPKAPTWFDGAQIAAQVRAALAKPARRPNMTFDHGPSPRGAGPGEGRRKENDS